ncbi:MAG: NEW3 domain-containing protein [Chloroflexota bacterium]
MSDRVPGRPGRTRLARVLLLTGLLGVVAGPLVPLASAAGSGLTVSTPFPGIVTQPGSTASFAVTLTATAAESVDLSASGVPTGWTGRFHGGGAVVSSAYVTPDKAVSVSYDLEVPADAAPTTTRIVLAARTAGGTESLPISITVDAAASGEVTLTSDFPELKGAGGGTFTFQLSLKNTTPAETTFALDATGAAGWTVTAKPAGQAQATSTTVAAGGSTTVTVAAQAPADATAGSYPIQATVTGGGKTITADMQVTITGSYKLVTTTPDGVLSAAANAGTEKTMTIQVNNTGTAPVTAITPTGSAPTGWKVTFEPATIASIEAGQSATVVAKIVPSTDAIAGDYEMSITAKGAEASDDVAIRVRVETPQLWWIAGLGLIVAVFAGLYWVFRTYGRR